MLTLCFTSSCFARSFFFSIVSYCIVVSAVVVVVAPVKSPFMRDSCYRSFAVFLLLFSISLCIRYFGHCGARRVNPFGPMINDRFLFYFLLFCTDFN